MHCMAPRSQTCSGSLSPYHSALIAPLCRLFGFLQLKVELACRCSGFITKCLRSANVPYCQIDGYNYE